MKKIYTLAIALFATVTCLAQTVNLCNFDFNGSASYPITAISTATNITASVSGTQTNAAYGGTATGSGAFIANTTAGNALSMSNSSGTNTAYWTLTLGGSDLLKYAGLDIYFQAEHSTTGATAITISYSTNGSTFTALSQTVAPGLNTTFTEANVDLSEATALNGSSNIYIRFAASGASSTGTLRIDNLQVKGSLIPFETSGSSTTFNGSITAPTLTVTGDARVNGSFTSGATTVSSLTISSLSGGGTNGNFVYTDSTGAFKVSPITPITSLITHCTTNSPWMIGGNKLGTVANAIIGTCDNHDFVMEANNTPYMWLKTNGQLGVGTSNPSGLFEIQSTANSSTDPSPFVISSTTQYTGVDSKLFEVTYNGQAYAREIFVQVTAFPDYVFKKDYKLMPLNEVEKYYKANKHLPEVPSEKEVKENGLNIGDMSTILLKKIEELTLYTVELEKKLKALEEKLNN